MTMKMKTVEITVGAFMVASLAALLMLALQVSGLSNFYREEPGYQVKAEFSNIGGLKVRAKVSVGGVVVGRVIHIGLEPQTFNAVATLVIDPKKVDKLPDDTRASILTAGLLGDNYIGLTPGFNEAEFLHEGSLIPVENTDSALVLESLVSKFLAGQATNAASNSNHSSSDSEHIEKTPQQPSPKP